MAAGEAFSGGLSGRRSWREPQRWRSLHSLVVWRAGREGRVAFAADWLRGGLPIRRRVAHFWAPPGLAATDIRGAVLDHYASASFVVENFAERIRCYELHIGVHHLAYNTFVPGREDDLTAIASRLRELI